MKIAVVGAGAMGSLFAGYLSGHDIDVWVYDVWQEHINAIKENGLRMTRNDNSRNVVLRATIDPTEPGQMDLVIIFVKYLHTRKAIQNSLPMIGSHTLVLTLQNGIGNVEILQEKIPEARILFGLTTLTSELLGPGHIEESFQGQGDTFFWPLKGMVDPQIDHVCTLFNKAGIHTEISPDVQLRIWKKLIVNACYNTLSAILHLKVGDIIDQPEVWPLLKGVAAEIVKVAQKKEIQMDKKEAIHFLEQVGEEARLHVPSMLVDANRKQKTEIESLNGAIVREAERFGIEVPYNRAVCAIVRTLEETYDKVIN